MRVKVTMFVEMAGDIVCDLWVLDKLSTRLYQMEHDGDYSKAAKDLSLTWEETKVPNGKD